MLQLYTSGTTGKPKGAVHTDASLGAQMCALHDAWGLSRADTLLHVLPLHHMHGLCIALLPMLTVGGATRMLSKFDANATWDAMAEHRLHGRADDLWSSSRRSPRPRRTTAR